MTGLLLAAVVAVTPHHAHSVAHSVAHGTPHTLCRHHTHLLTRYSRLWHQVRHLHGNRAPGRNIRAWGMSDGHPSRCGDLVKSATVLHRMVFPGARLLSPGRPYVPPARTATLHVTSWPLSSIRSCESGGNYQAVNPNGHYGAYQFDKLTWRSVGGSGNPADASPQEQDMRAARLYAQRGSQPWACKP